TCLLQFGTPEAREIVLELGRSENENLRLAVAGALSSSPAEPRFAGLLLHLLQDEDPQVRWTACSSLFGASRSSATYPEVWDSMEYGPCSGIDGPEWKEKTEKIRSVIKLPE
ncbi:MAG TPA: HEAT repeat domain-containing protein, partial [Acidobacteriota bacterium]|nr:HEAT repeat domain-containing protein [Acidobacteriota bacterium]